MDDAAFPERYGPWALIVGASEGVGTAVAHAVAHFRPAGRSLKEKIVSPPR